MLASLALGIVLWIALGMAAPDVPAWQVGLSVALIGASIAGLARAIIAVLDSAPLHGSA